MFDRVILGVDPGTRALGLACVGAERGAKRPSVIWWETVRTSPSLEPAERLRRLSVAVREAIARHRPEALALERLMWGRNAGSAMDVARASGAVMVAAAEAGVPVHEYAPLEVKMAVTGVGNASKEQVRRGLGLLLGPAAVPDEPDAADALAAALCHLQQSRLRTLVREAAR
jgi:crossover junction endodeoxyribonuclease RuvC